MMDFTFFIKCLVGICCLAFNTTPALSDSYELSVVYASQDFEKRRYVLAVKRTELIMKHYSRAKNDAYVHFIWGASMCKLGNMRAADAQLRYVISIDPDGSQGVAGRA